MKNVQIIDSARNCAYDIYEMSDELFDLIFGNEGKNIEFIEDFSERVWIKMSKEDQLRFDKEMFSKPVEKSKIVGIHGTLFYELKNEKQSLYPNKMESDLNTRGREWDHP